MEGIIMGPLPDWRSPHLEDELSRLDRGGVSFEFLRRNRQYRQDYTDTLVKVASGAEDKAEAIDRLSRRWGLAFPDGPFCIGRDRAANLVASALSRNSHCHGCARRICRVFAS